MATASNATCGEVQWASYWAHHGNATFVPPRTCKTIADYECYADENWWPKPDNSTPVNGIDEPWSQEHCASVCTADKTCTAFVYGYECYEAGGKDAAVPKRCTGAAPTCLFSNIDPVCHVPRCYTRSIAPLSYGNASCGKFQGGGHVGCSMKQQGSLLSWGEFALYISKKTRAA